MGWVRISLSPEDRVRLSKSDPALLARLDSMNAEANLLDPLTRPSRLGDAEEYVGEAKDRGLA